MMVDERGKRVITERELREAGPGATLRIHETAIITPLARDVARELGIKFEPQPAPASARKYRIALGCDHGGYQAKERIKTMLVEMGHDFQDFGANSLDPVDYPDFAHLVAIAVAGQTCQLGIIVDGAGIGSCMVANKVPGVRAALCYDEPSARNSREHNGANVLTLGGKTMSHEQMEAILTTWLTSELTEERHRRRIDKIGAIEQEYLKRPSRWIR